MASAAWNAVALCYEGFDILLFALGASEARAVLSGATAAASAPSAALVPGLLPLALEAGGQHDLISETALSAGAAGAGLMAMPSVGLNNSA